jgi:hypothetical protein
LRDRLGTPVPNKISGELVDTIARSASYCSKNTSRCVNHLVLAIKGDYPSLPIVERLNFRISMLGNWPAIRINVAPTSMIPCRSETLVEYAEIDVPLPMGETTIPIDVSAESASRAPNDCQAISIVTGKEVSLRVCRLA